MVAAIEVVPPRERSTNNDVGTVGSVVIGPYRDLAFAELVECAQAASLSIARRSLGYAVNTDQAPFVLGNLVQRQGIVQVSAAS